MPKPTHAVVLSDEKSTTKKPSEQGTRTLYDILEVEKTATVAQIRKQYRQLSKQLHPDRNPSPDAGEQFKALKRAYDILSDTSKRALYDSALIDEYGNAVEAATETVQEPVKPATGKTNVQDVADESGEPEFVQGVPLPKTSESIVNHAWIAMNLFRPVVVEYEIVFFHSVEDAKAYAAPMRVDAYIPVILPPDLLLTEVFSTIREMLADEQYTVGGPARISMESQGDTTKTPPHAKLVCSAMDGIKYWMEQILKQFRGLEPVSPTPPSAPAA